MQIASNFVDEQCGQKHAHTERRHLLCRLDRQQVTLRSQHTKGYGQKHRECSLERAQEGDDEFRRVDTHLQVAIEGQSMAEEQEKVESK